MRKSLEFFRYFIMLDPAPYPVVKCYNALTSRRDVRITKYDVYHVLVILTKSYLVSKNKLRGGVIAPLPQLFFALSHEYAESPSTKPISFIRNSLKRRGISWCFNDLLRFMESYGDVITLFFSMVDAVYLRSDLGFRTAILLYVSADIVPEPYSHVIPGIDSSLFEKIELSRKALTRIYKLIKERITSLTSGYRNPAYINARNIASAMLYYILLVEGVRRVLHYDYGKPDPHLALLFSLNKEFIEYSSNWEKHLLNK